MTDTFMHNAYATDEATGLASLSMRDSQAEMDNSPAPDGDPDVDSIVNSAKVEVLEPGRRLVHWAAAGAVETELFQDGGVPAFKLGDFRDPEASRDPDEIAHLTLRYRICYLGGAGSFNVLDPDSGVEHAQKVRDRLVALMEETHGQDDDVRSLTLSFRIRHGKASVGFNRSPEVRAPADSYEYVDVTLPFWEEGMLGMLKGYTINTSLTQCTFVALGPVVDPSYVLQRLTMPNVPRFVPDAERYANSSLGVFQEVLRQVSNSFDQWVKRHRLAGYRIVGLGGVFRPLPTDVAQVDFDAWTNVLYLVVRVPRSSDGAFDPLISNKLPGFYDLTTDEHNAARVEARAQFPHRAACALCKSRATHLGGEKNCTCLGCGTLGHQKRTCPFALGRIISRKRGFSSFEDMSISEDVVKGAIQTALASVTVPRVKLSASPAFKRFKAAKSVQ